MPTDRFRLIEHALGRDLTQQLRSWQAAKVSAEAVARMLSAETGIPLVGQTVRQWGRRLNGHA